MAGAAAREGDTMMDAVNDVLKSFACGCDDKETYNNNVPPGWGAPSHPRADDSLLVKKASLPKSAPNSGDSVPLMSALSPRSPASPSDGPATQSWPNAKRTAPVDVEMERQLVAKAQEQKSALEAKVKKAQAIVEGLKKQLLDVSANPEMNSEHKTAKLRNELTRYRSDVFPQLNQQIENLESEIKQHSAGMNGKLKSRPFLFKADSFSKSMSRRNSITSEKSPPGSRRNSHTS